MKIVVVYEYRHDTNYIIEGEVEGCATLREVLSVYSSEEFIKIVNVVSHNGSALGMMGDRLIPMNRVVSIIEIDNNNVNLGKGGDFIV